MKQKTISIGLALAALVLTLGLSGCGRSKQNAAMALDEARLNISAARNSGAQTYAAQTLQSAEAALKKGEKAFEASRYSIAKDEAAAAAALAVTAKDEAEKKAAEKKASKKVSGSAKKTASRAGRKK